MNTKTMAILGFWISLTTLPAYAGIVVDGGQGAKDRTVESIFCSAISAENHGKEFVDYFENPPMVIVGEEAMDRLQIDIRESGAATVTLTTSFLEQMHQLPGIEAPVPSYLKPTVTGELSKLDVSGLKYGHTLDLNRLVKIGGTFRTKLGAGKNVVGFQRSEDGQLEANVQAKIDFHFFRTGRQTKSVVNTLACVHKKI